MTVLYSGHDCLILVMTVLYMPIRSRAVGGWVSDLGDFLEVVEGEIDPQEHPRLLHHCEPGTYKTVKTI